LGRKVPSIRMPEYDECREPVMLRHVDTGGDSIEL
jgi:hypothetical protein